MLKLSLALLAFAGSLSADVIFSNFGPGDLFEIDTRSSVAIGDLFMRGGVELNWRAAVQFTAPVNTAFTGADFALARFSFSAPISINLMTDVNGLPGDVLESFTVPPETVLTGITSVRSGLHPPLLEHENYWLGIELPTRNNAGNHLYWIADPMNQGPGAQSFYYPAIEMSYPGWYLNPVDRPASTFRVFADPVPEPFSFLLVAPVLAAGLCLRRFAEGRPCSGPKASHTSLWIRNTF